MDQAPTRELAPEFSGSASVESYTVMYKGDQPAMGHLALRRSVIEPALPMRGSCAITTEECCGRAAGERECCDLA